MNIKIDFTSFRRMIRPLSVYSEKSRSGDFNPKVKWAIGEDIRIFGYQQPDHQTRLTEIRLYGKNSPVLSNDYPGILTEVPMIRGMGTATDGDKLIIKIEPGQDYQTICTDNFRYDFEAGEGNPDMHIEEYYLPMNQIKVRATISSNELKKYVYLAPSGPLRLKISNDAVKFVSRTDLEKASLDITNYVTYSENDDIEYLYDLSCLSETLKKFPSNKKIKLCANNNLIRLKYNIGDDIGHVNYYQQMEVNNSRIS